MIWPIFACAVLMRLKGGGHAGFVEWVATRSGSKFLDLVLGAKFLSTVGFGLVCLLVGYPWWQAVLGAFGWLCGVAPSVGEIIGSIGGYKGNWRIEGEKWGWKMGAQRGVFCGACIALALWNPAFIIAGAMFPLVYWIGVSIEQYRRGIVAAPWDWSEWFYGAVIGAAFLAG